jgi:predicted transcriptional regulator
MTYSQLKEKNMECVEVTISPDRKTVTKDRRFDHFTVRDLMEDLPPLETVRTKRSLREALARMCAKECSQLLIIRGKTCIGALTLESVIRQLKEENRKRNRAMFQI